MRWNDPDTWVWSDTAVQEPLLSVEDSTAVRRIAVQGGGGRRTRQRERVRRGYALRGLLVCGLPDAGQYSHGAAYYRCRYLAECALVGGVPHPRNVYLAEQEVLALLDGWLLRAFGPQRLADTLARLHAPQPEQVASAEPAVDGAVAVIVACDEKLVRFRAIAEAGGDPATIAGWIAEVNAQRAAALARRPLPALETKNTQLSPSVVERLIVRSTTSGEPSRRPTLPAKAMSTAGSI
jgi:hypothetical protein